jgi:hypothetical protein
VIFVAFFSISLVRIALLSGIWTIRHDLVIAYKNEKKTRFEAVSIVNKSFSPTSRGMVPVSGDSLPERWPVSSDFTAPPPILSGNATVLAKVRISW